MYKILLCCASGVTTSKLVEAIKEEGASRGFKLLCWAVAETAIEMSFADADCILVAQQVKGSLEKIKTAVNGTIPCGLIDEEAFVNMDGVATLNQAISLIDNK